MVLLILGICILILVGGVIWYAMGNYEEAAFVPMGIGGVLGAIALLVVLILGISVSGLSVIDERIAMYEEENAKIEEQIATVVEQYQKYESDILTELTPESAITLVSLYPELKADTLVAKQIDVYIQNNEKIKSLRESQIEGSVLRWWLYFGG